jgi:hypothetical protein
MSVYAEFCDDQLDELFHITGEIQKRSIPLIPVYAPEYDGKHSNNWSGENEDWYVWLPDENKDLNKVNAQPVQSAYFAKEPARGSDIYFEFLDHLLQLSLTNSVDRSITRIREDIFNLAASFSKIGFYQNKSQDSDLNTVRLVKTEIEYIFTLCRSLYDLLQEVSHFVWENIELHDGGGNQLPRSFADIALHAGDPVPSEELEERYGLTPELSNFYNRAANDFSSIKSYRDDIIHNGRRVDFLFWTEKGYAVSKDQEPFCDFDIWESDYDLPNNLAPIWPPLAYTAYVTLETLIGYFRALAKDINLPPKLAPGYQVYLRGHYLNNLTKLSDILDGDQWGSGIGDVLESEFS